MTPKIFVYCIPGGWSEDVIGYAIAEDGAGLASHISSGTEWSKYDMGISGDRKHDKYKEHYPSGYELEWINAEDLASHDTFRAAYALNQAQAEGARA